VSKATKEAEALLAAADVQGEWRRTAPLVEADVRDANDNHIATCYGGRERFDNAALIAATPRLLRALLAELEATKAKHKRDAKAMRDATARWTRIYYELAAQSRKERA
jgi:hypothetical protein